MRIHVYTPCWNEEKILPYFLRHYGPLAERIVFFDNGSTDRSAEIIAGCPNALLHRFDTGGAMAENALREIRNHAWKASRGHADWVIVADADEFIWHQDLPGYLESLTRAGVTLCHCIGYEMGSRQFPTTGGQIYDEIKFGIPRRYMCKLAVFDPNAIEEINYDMGAHAAQPDGRVVLEPHRQLLLLHYNMLGMDYMLPRYAARFARVPAEDRAANINVHYGYDVAKVTERHEMVLRRAVQVVP
jgi:glycosyltransferase involved in cell wall biosynthesis